MRNRPAQFGLFLVVCLVWGLVPSFGATAKKRPVVRKKSTVASKKKSPVRPTPASRKKPAVRRPVARPQARRAMTVPGRQLTPQELAGQQNFVAGFEVAPKTQQQEQLWSSAKSFLGVPYVYAGNTRTGTDCSGFTSTIYGELGLPIPRAANEQFRIGQAVQQDELTFGDLVFFGASQQSVSHVGLYLGDGKFSHAALTTRNVRIDKLGPTLGNIRYLGARRVLPGLTSTD